MKLRFFNFALVLALAALAVFSACKKETEEIIIDSALPQGTFTSAKSGSFVEQNATGSKGAVQMGIDSKNVQFVKFGSDFSTVLATGTVTVYLSTSMDFKADPASGNPDLRLIGTIAKNGENYFKLDPAAQAKFTHIILWCGSANVPFGYAKLQ